MITIKYIDSFGWKGAIKGLRNPMNNWDKSDTEFDLEDGFPIIGPEDRKLMTKLDAAGPEHRKFLRFIHVQLDITAPLYWWKEFDTYKVGTAANSCSTMHKIHAKEFTIDDFSREHLMSLKDIAHDCGVSDLRDLVFAATDKEEGKLYAEDWYTCPRDGACIVIAGADGILSPAGQLALTIKMLNRARELYLQTKNKKYWWQMIQLLPSSYNQTRTVDLNYEVLRNIYRQRKDHKLDEWHTFCEWMTGLPYFLELITLEEDS